METQLQPTPKSVIIGHTKTEYETIPLTVYNYTVHYKGSILFIMDEFKEVVKRIDLSVIRSLEYVFY